MSHGLPDVTLQRKHTTRDNIAWLTGSEVRMSINFA